MLSPRFVRRDSLKWMKSIKERKDEKSDDCVRRHKPDDNVERQAIKFDRANTKTCSKTRDKKKHQKCKESSPDMYSHDAEMKRTDLDSPKKIKYQSRREITCNKTSERPVESRRKYREARSKSRDRRGKSCTRNGKSLERRDYCRERKGAYKEVRDGASPEPVISSRRIRESKAEIRGPCLERIRPHRERNEETLRREVQGKVKSNNVYKSNRTSRNQYEEYALEKLNLRRRSSSRNTNKNVYHRDVQCDDQTEKVNNCTKCFRR